MCISVNIILVASASTVASREVLTDILCEDSDYTWTALVHNILPDNFDTRMMTRLAVAVRTYNTACPFQLIL